MKIISRIIGIIGIALIQLPALAYTDFKEEKKVILFGFLPKAKYTIEYGDLKLSRSVKLAVDKCGTVTLKASKLDRRWGIFKDAEDYIIQGDNKTSIIVNIKKSVLDAQQASIDWDTVESTQFKYSCLNGVINPKIVWIEKDGIKFFKYAKPGSPVEKLYISGIRYSTVKLKTPQEEDAKKVTRKVSSDKCGAITIRDNPDYPNALLGQFRIYEVGNSYGTNWNYDFATIPEAASRDLIECNRYKR